MVSSRRTLVNKMDASKKHMKTLWSRSRFCMILAKVNESDMQCDENRSNTGCSRPANHFSSLWWDEPVIDSIGQSRVSSLCVFGKPCIRGLCDPVGRITSYIHFGIRSALTKSSNCFWRHVSMLAVLSLLETRPSLLNFDWSSRILFILST